MFLFFIPKQEVCAHYYTESLRITKVISMASNLYEALSIQYISYSKAHQEDEGRDYNVGKV